MCPRRGGDASPFGGIAPILGGGFPFPGMRFVPLLGRGGIFPFRETGGCAPHFFFSEPEKKKRASPR